MTQSLKPGSAPAAASDDDARVLSEGGELVNVLSWDAIGASGEDVCSGEFRVECGYTLTSSGDILLNFKEYVKDIEK